MLWRQLQSCSSALLPFLYSPRPFPSFQANSRGAMRTLVQKTHDLKESPFRCSHISPFYKTRSFSTPTFQSIPFGFLQHHCISLHNSFRKNCGSSMDHDVVIQCGLPSPTHAEGMTDVFYPTLRHSSSFLQMCFPEGEAQEVNSTFALLILNHDLPLMTSFLWSKASCRICADGGANRVYDDIYKLFPHEDPMRVRERYKPDVIKGDLDSIRPEVKEFYDRLGTKFLHLKDQDSTDFWKCVAYAVDSLHDLKKGHMKLLVLGALGGRLDHTFANVNTLYLFREVRIVLLSDESMAFLLARGYTHEIKIDPSVEGPYCGLLPLGGPSACTTTTGLKWDLNKSSLQFGGLISTSNMPVGDHVTVSSDIDLLWTINLELLHSRLKEQVGFASGLPNLAS